MATSDILKPETADPGKKRLRSPAYPYVNLEIALRRAKSLHDREGRNSAPIAVAAKHWGFEPKSSAAIQTAAALISFGLLQDEGTGDKRRVKLSPDALRIILDTRTDSSEKESLLKKVALAPRIHQQIWSRWGAEGISAENLKHALIFDWETPFNEKSVDNFIREYKDTISFAKLADADKSPVEDGSSGDAGGDKYVPKVGDYVQWESQGIMQHKEPVRVTGISADGSHAFVEGTSTGLPVHQLKRATVPPVPPSQPPFNLTNVRMLLPSGKMQEDIYSLPEGRVVIQWPVGLTSESIQDIKDWLKLVERKISRSLAPQASQGEGE